MIDKMKKSVRRMLAGALAVSLLCSCSADRQTTEQNSAEKTDESVTIESTESPADSQTETDSQTGQDTETAEGPAEIGERPLLIGGGSSGAMESVVPCVAPYVVEPDLSNVDNAWQFYFYEGKQEKFVQNGFVVEGYAGKEFFEIYEQNRYDQIASFVTVDSMMHTYHLYFSYLLRSVEKNYLIEDLSQLSRKMLDDSVLQYEQLKGSEWEDAAKRNVAFFAVGTRLLDTDGEQETGIDYVADVVEYELANIEKAEGIGISQIREDEEDYTQYKPRGYYEGDETLEKYFRAMMWYGRIHFAQENEDMNRSALLMTKALSEDAEAYRLWESLYAVTSFFAGASDDMGVCEYAPIMYEIYGKDMALQDLIGNDGAFEQFCSMVAELPAPQINSIPIYESEETNVIPGFRFMGQRFTIDGSIMQRLIFRDVKENKDGEKRMLPDVLDVPAALGSDAALGILEENGATGYEGYSENMEKLREGLSEENETLWTASLYANWLNTLRPLLVPKGEGYPMFMQNEEWTKKNLECFAGSFTELKHDTVLYSKQVMAQMGGGWEEEPDDRGYVEPEPLVYTRFADLADLTAQGLDKYGMLSATDKENLTRLSEMAHRLVGISEKELQDETLTDDEYEFIRTYGGNLEHFWYEAVKDEADTDSINSQEYPAAIVVDIATDPNGWVLEAGTGDPSTIYVAVKVDGKVKIARGSVYSFYQFVWPMDDRLTDEKWRVMMGIQPNEEGYYNMDSQIEQPEWTKSYRYQYQYE